MSQGGDSNPLDDALNFLIQVPTLGALGFDNGKIKAGVTTKTAMDATKEITGANAAEEANAMAKQQYEENKIKALQDRENAQNANQRSAVAASNAAGSARSSTTTSKSVSNRVGDTKDFLGL